MSTFTYQGKIWAHDGRPIIVTRPVEFVMEEFQPYEPAAYCHDPGYLVVPVTIEEAADNDWYFISQGDVIEYEGYCLDCMYKRNKCRCAERELGES